MGPIKRLRKTFKSCVRRAHRRLLPLEKRPGVLFIGYAEGGLGLGQSFRCDVAAALQVDLRLAIYPFKIAVETRLIGPFLPQYYDISHVYKINIIEVSADQLPNVFRFVDHRITGDSYNILRTYWELPQAPAAWRSMLTGIDELWAPNEFVAEAFRGIFSGKITIIPPAVDPGDAPFEGRAAFGLEPDRYYFLFSFDYFSSPYRKNPQAALRAFQEAFPDDADRVGLIIKSIGTVEQFPEIRTIFLEAAARDPRIVLIDGTLQRHEMLNLIQSCDAYVSLHRAEGFGAGMAEAMNFGKTVIGTNFSGNTEFLTSESGFPISCTLRPVEGHEYHWSTGQVWAEPDVGEAAAIMRSLIENPEIARRRARTGQAFVKQKYGPSAVGQAMRRRIEEIETQLADETRA